MPRTFAEGESQGDNPNTAYQVCHANVLVLPEPREQCKTNESNHFYVFGNNGQRKALSASGHPLDVW